ncbi:hypothetical protein ACFC1T_17900 [Kitasatospora sp. NPDC056076]|uniref:hypothetical protein n=1 Tax=Streptomycetaceae TaxID=2062 RepID=UPI0035E21446
MLLLGLLLAAAAGAFSGLLIADNLGGGPDYQVTVVGQQLTTLNSLEIFLSGLALALIFCLGLALAVATGRRRRRTPPVGPATEGGSGPDLTAAEQGGRSAGAAGTPGHGARRMFGR